MHCMIYIAMNMVRAGVVKHPSEWLFSGYSELQSPRQRYTLIDCQCLMGLLNCGSRDELKDLYRSQVEYALSAGPLTRQSKWTDSLAVGSQPFVEEVQAKLGIKAAGRTARETNDGYELREPQQLAYSSDLAPKNGLLRHQNTYFWNIYRK